MKKIFLKFLAVYKKYFSPDSGFLKKAGFVSKPVCVFYPTCSEYTAQAVQKYGFWKGVYLGAARIIRCHPWQKNHLDPLK